MLFFSFSAIVFGQDLGQIGKAKLFKLTGGITANTVFYDGTSNREPFTYFLSGNVNLNISNVFTIPFTFSYSNQEFLSSNPFSYNRLSIHPSYKWITTHIGDVNMTFSPYTLNGHQFTGLGVDLTPKGAFKISAMYGQLLKEAEYDPENNQSLVAYKRIGYGVKASYDFKKFSVGTILFKAKDDETSLKDAVPFELELLPKENIVGSIESTIKLFDKGEVHFEVASSVITEDINAQTGSGNTGILSGLITNNITTKTYTAYNTDFTYQVGKGSVGLGYERVAPEYRTLGAYFFNNDLENITVNASQNILKDKVNVSFNAGLQKDDLNNTKSTKLRRLVSAANITYTASEKLNFTGAYSNFQSFTNVKDQFDAINEVSPVDNLDTLNFRQISQSANLNTNYVLKNSKTRRDNINLGLSFQSSKTLQNDQESANGNSVFYNSNAAYSMGFPEKDLDIATAVNLSYNTIDQNDGLTFGPTLSVSKRFLDKKLRTNASVSYNQTQNNGEKQGEVTNVRMRGNYTYLKKHNFTINLLSQFRNSNSNSSQDFTATLAYNYSFDQFKPKIKFSKSTKPARQSRSKRNKEFIKINYRDSLYAGTRILIDQKLERLQKNTRFDHIPAYKKGELTMLRGIVRDQKNNKEYKVKAISFLDELYRYDDFLENYNKLIYNTIVELQKDMLHLDYAFENSYVVAKFKSQDHPLDGETIEQQNKASKVTLETYKKLKKDENDALDKLIRHRWMLPVIANYDSYSKVKRPDKYLKEFMELEKINIFRMVDKEKSHQEINSYIITQIVEFYFEKSEKYINPLKFELKYIDKD